MTRLAERAEQFLAWLAPAPYVPDLEAHRKHDEAVLFAAHPEYHVWVYTADGQVCSFCGRVRDWTEPKPEPRAEEYPLWLTLPDTTGEAA